MKTQIKHVPKRALSIVLAMLMIVSTMLVGMVSVSASSTDTIYIVPADLFSSYMNDNGKLNDDYYIRVNYKKGTNSNDTWDHEQRFSITDKTINSKAVYSCDFTSEYSGTSTMQIQLYQTNQDGDIYISQTIPNGNDSWVSSKTYSGKLWTGSKWENPTFDSIVTYSLYNDNTKLGDFTSGVLKASLTKDTTYKFWVKDSNNATYYNGSGKFSNKSVNLYKNDNTTSHTIEFIPSISGEYTFNWNDSHVSDNDPYGTLSYAEPTTPSTTDYYIGGRFGESWNASSTTHKFQTTDTTGIYKYETGKTVKELSENYDNLAQYFFIHTGSGKTTEWYGNNNSTNGHKFENATADNKFTLSTKSANTDTIENNLLRFNNSSSTDANPVTLWLDTTGTSFKLWYTTGGGSQPTEPTTEATEPPTTAPVEAESYLSIHGAVPVTSSNTWCDGVGGADDINGENKLRYYNGSTTIAYWTFTSSSSGGAVNFHFKYDSKVVLGDSGKVRHYKPTGSNVTISGNKASPTTVDTASGNYGSSPSYTFNTKANTTYNIFVDTASMNSSTLNNLKVWYEVSGGTVEPTEPTTTPTPVGDSNYVLNNNSTSLGTFSTTSTTNTYELTVQLEANKDYKLWVKDNQESGSKKGEGYYAGGTLSLNSSATLYHYGSGTANITFKPSDTGTYKFTWKCNPNTTDTTTTHDRTILGAKSGTLTVTRVGTSVASTVKISGESSVLEGTSYILTANVSGLAEGLEENQLKYQWLVGGKEISGATGKTYTVDSAVKGSYTYTVRVSTNIAADDGQAYMSKTSSQFTVTVKGKGTYYSGNILKNASTPGWTSFGEKTTVTFTVDTSKMDTNGKYEFAMSDIDGYDADYNVAFTLDQAGSKYVKLSTDSYEYNESPIKTYVVTRNSVAVTSFDITIDANARTIKAVGTIDKSKLNSSTNTYDNTSEKVTYYFAEKVGQENHCKTGDGLTIRYWNNSYDYHTGGTTVDVVKKVTLNNSDSNIIHVNTTKSYHGGGDATDTYKVYSVDLPVSATSFAFVNTSGGLLQTYSTMKSKDYFGSLSLNPNRIYCYYSKGNNDNYCFGITLDESFWRGSVTDNQVATQNFKSNIVNYVANEGTDDGGVTAGWSTINDNKNINNVLKDNVWGTYSHPLYFGYLGEWDNSTNSDQVAQNQKLTGGNFKIWENLALRKNNDERYYHASVQGLVGDTLGKSANSQFGSLRLADDSADYPLFDYDNDTVMDKIVYKGQASGHASGKQLYTNQNFPFNKSEFDGVTTYSYDSGTDYNRTYDVTNHKFVVDKGYQESRITNDGKMLAYSPFHNYTPFDYGFGQEFDVEFYMSSTGKLSTESGSTKDITFDFSGDDDVWVYVDGVLVLDLGGDHKISSGSINFSDMMVYYKSSAIDTSEISSISHNPVHRKYIKTVNLKELFKTYGVDFSNTDSTTKHTLQMFYMERGSFDSNLSVSFNLPQSSGLTVSNTIDSSAVNTGLVNAAMATANNDYFQYTVGNKLANAGNLGNIISELNAKGLTDVAVDTEYRSTKPSDADKATFTAAAKKIYYQSGYNIFRVYGSVNYRLNKGNNAKPTGETSDNIISSDSYLNTLNPTSYRSISSVVYELKDKYIKADNNVENYVASGRTDGSGKLNLLFDQSAVFDSTIFSNTMVKISQSDAIGTVSTNSSGTIASETGKRKVSEYYSTKYSIYDASAKQTLTESDSVLYTNDAVYAAQDGAKDNGFYFANYDSTANDTKTVAMVVTYENKIEVGSIEITKQLSDESMVSTANFYFDIAFSNVFGGDNNTARTYENLVYDVLDSNGNYVDQGKRYGSLGIVIKAGQTAVINGVPVGTKYTITERSTSGYSLNDASGTVTDKSGESADLTVNYKDNEQTVVSGLSGEIPVINSGNADAKIVAEALMTNAPQALTITFKYYDRDVENGTVAHINSSPTSYTVTYKSPNEYETLSDQTIFTRNEDGTYATFEMARLIQETFNNSALTPGNVIDEYVFFASNAAASAGMANQDKIYEEGKYSGDALIYHTNSIGRVAGDGKQWITYTDSDGNTVAETADADVLGSVTNIEVWLFNTLKTYTVTSYGVTGSNAVLTNATTNFETLSDGKLKYKNNVVREKISAYYNQRLGAESSADNQNDNGTYLNDYNLNGYIGSTPYTAEEITVNGTTYYFQYWVNENNVILSTDLNYRNRVTQNMTLYPVYDTEEFEGYGVSVTENVRDIYFDGNGVSRTRLNTQMHVYGLKDNADIEKTAIVLVTFDNFNAGSLSSTEMEKLREDIADILDQTSGDATIAGKAVTIDVSRKTNGFVYDIKNGNSGVTLTNKNRLQFTVDFKTASLNDKPLLAVAAIYYDGKWTVSDNYIVHAKSN